MSSLIAFSILAILSYFLVHLIRRYAERRQILDHPNARSSHSMPTPRGGGVAIVVLVAGARLWSMKGAELKHALILVKTWAARKNATPAQLSLAWLAAQKPWIVPIPGTTNPAHLEENAAAASVSFSAAELTELNAAVAAIPIRGERLSPAVLSATGVEAAPKR